MRQSCRLCLYLLVVTVRRGVLNKPAIWPHRYFHNDVQIDGTTIKDYCLFADYQVTHQSTLGVIVHELGHLMLGLPDLYARYTKASIGTWGVSGRRFMGDEASAILILVKRQSI
ncbi:hypothetical protein P4S64_19700 [Vibrio sp. M60_M31a]